MVTPAVAGRRPDRMTWDAVRLLVSIWALPAAVVVAAVVVWLAYWRRKRPKTPQPGLWVPIIRSWALTSGPITGPSPLLRAGPPLCPASVLSHSQCSLLVVLPLAASNPGRLYRGDRFSCSMPAPATSSRHLYTGHHRGHIQPAPRLRTHRGEPLSRDHPQIPVSMPSLFRFDASAVVHTCSSSHRTPAPLTARRQPQRSPPRLLTDAACGGSQSPPARRPRRTHLHHWHSTDRADDLLHHHHFPSGHTWVPETGPWRAEPTLPILGPMCRCNLVEVDATSFWNTVLGHSGPSVSRAALPKRSSDGSRIGSFAA